MLRITPIVLTASVLASVSLAEPPRPVRKAPTTEPSVTIDRKTIGGNAPDIKLDGVAFSDAIDALRDASGLNIHVNWRAIETAGIGKDVVVNVSVKNITLRKALNLILAEAGQGQLAWYVDNKVVEITTKEIADHDLITKTYPVEDLLVEVPDFAGPSMSLTSSSGGGGGGRGRGGSGGGGGGGSSGGLFEGSSNSSNNANQTTLSKAERGQQIVDLIQSTIEPDIWKTNGGPASIRYFNGSLIVTAPRSVHEALGK